MNDREAKDVIDVIPYIRSMFLPNSQLFLKVLASLEEASSVSSKLCVIYLFAVTMEIFRRHGSDFVHITLFSKKYMV